MISAKLNQEPIVTDVPKNPVLFQVYSEHMEHARHLEKYLLSFTQVFLAITGGLWGYALVKLKPFLSVATVPISTAIRARTLPQTNSALSFVGAVFLFHLFYSLVGALFVTRSSVNFRKHLDAARAALNDGGFEKYIVHIPPDNPGGWLESRGLRKPFYVILTVKAFFVALFIGAAGVDTYFVQTVLSRAALPHQMETQLWDSLMVMSVFLLIIVVVYIVLSAHTKAQPAPEGHET